MTTPWLSHLLLCSLSLCVLGLAALSARAWLRRDPVLGYRFLSAGLIMALLAPFAQLALEGRATFSDSPLSPIRDGVYFPPSPRPSISSTAHVPADVAVPPDATSHPSAALPASTPSAVDADSVVDERLQRDLTSRLQLLLVVVYAVGAVVALLARGRRFVSTALFLRRCPEVRDPDLLAVWKRISAGSRLSGRVVLRESRELATPACWGVVRPTIVVPSADVADPPRPAFEWALAHELVHLERRDPGTAMLQAVFTAVFWFHPVAVWISRELDHLREVSCDELVVRARGRRKSYALALLEYSRSRQNASESSAAMILHRPTALPPLLPWSPRRADGARPLKRRIEMLLANQRRPARRRRVLAAACAGLTLTGIGVAQLTVAGTFPDDDEVLVARCDPKKKQQQQQQRPGGSCEEPFTKPPRRSKGESRPDEIVRGDDGKWSPDALRAWAATQGDPSFVTPSPMESSPEPLDADVKDALIGTLLRDKYSIVRMAAAEALAPHVRDQDVRRAFLTALRSGRDESVRATILDSLLRREPISADLRELLVDLCALDDEEVDRITVTEGLAQYVDDPQARRALATALLDDSNERVQILAARALARHVGETEIEGAMVQALLKSRNEIARMVMIDAIGPQVAESQSVRDLFLRLLRHDDNELARMRIAEIMALRADEGEVRSAMLSALQKDVDASIKMTFAEALSPYVHGSDVKQAFIACLRQIDNEMVRMTMVGALAGGASSGWHRASSGLPVVHPQLREDTPEIRAAYDHSRY